MTTVRLLWLLLCLLWIGAEIYLARKTRVDNSGITDIEERSQRLLWLTLVSGLLLALLFKTWAWMPIPIQYLPRQLLALLLFGFGLWIRYQAVVCLGRFFTTNVSIHTEHQLIVAGPYRWLRHPAYAGLLIAFVAAGLAMGDFMALTALTIPSFFAFKFRIAIEEKLLAKKLGSAYLNYSQTTWKLVPWLY